MNRSFLIAAMLAVGLTACGEKPAPAPAPAPAPSKEVLLLEEIRDLLKARN